MFIMSHAYTMYAGSQWYTVGGGHLFSYVKEDKAVLSIGDLIKLTALLYMRCVRSWQTLTANYGAALSYMCE